MPSLSDVLALKAPLQYVKAPADGAELYFYYMKELPEGVHQKTDLELEEVTTQFTDIRSLEHTVPFSLQQNGFTLQRLHCSNDVDWCDTQQVLALLVLNAVWEPMQQDTMLGCATVH